MPKVLDWAATSADGLPLARREFIGTGNLPLGYIRSMEVSTSHPGAPHIQVKCRPEAEETIRVFTRRSMPVAFGGKPSAEIGETVVVEIQQGGGRFVRLYLRHDGIILSSEEHHG